MLVVAVGLAPNTVFICADPVASKQLVLLGFRPAKTQDYFLQSQDLITNNSIDKMNCNFFDYFLQITDFNKIVGSHSDGSATRRA